MACPAVAPVQLQLHESHQIHIAPKGHILSRCHVLFSLQWHAKAASSTCLASTWQTWRIVYRLAPSGSIYQQVLQNIYVTKTNLQLTKGVSGARFLHFYMY